MCETAAVAPAAAAAAIVIVDPFGAVSGKGKL